VRGLSAKRPQFVILISPTTSSIPHKIPGHARAKPLGMAPQKPFAKLCDMCGSPAFSCQPVVFPATRAKKEPCRIFDPSTAPLRRDLQLVAVPYFCRSLAVFYTICSSRTRPKSFWHSSAGRRRSILERRFPIQSMACNDLRTQVRRSPTKAKARFTVVESRTRLFCVFRRLPALVSASNKPLAKDQAIHSGAREVSTKETGVNSDCPI
jgi:hypothetical protein